MDKIKKSGKNSSLEVGPRYTLLIPFCNKMKNPKLLGKLLFSAFAKAEKEIQTKYPKKNADFLLKRLHTVIKDVKKIPPGKTLAIFISKFAKNVYFFTPTGTLPLPPVKVH